MREDAGSETLRAIGDHVIKRAGNERGGPIRHRVREAKGEHHDGEGEPGKSAERHRLESFRDEESEKKSAPEDFLDQWHDDDETEKAQGQRRPVVGRRDREGVGIKTSKPRREVQKLLRRDPEKKDKKRDDDGKDRPSQRLEFVLTAEIKQESGAEKRLERENPKLRGGPPERRAGSFQGAAQPEQGDEDQHGQRIGEDLTSVGRGQRFAVAHRRKSPGRRAGVKCIGIVRRLRPAGKEESGGACGAAGLAQLLLITNRAGRANPTTVEGESPGMIFARCPRPKSRHRIW